MLNTKNWGNTSTLARRVMATDDYFVLPAGAAPEFHVGTGEHYYLTVRNLDRHEVVRVVGTVGNELMVERGQDGTHPQSFAVGSCLAVEWNPQQLREFMEGVRWGAEPTGVVPGIYCLECTTCMSINAAGQITSINSPGGC